jgi:hypothetical protein
VKAIYSRWLVVHALGIVLLVVRPLCTHLAIVIIDAWDLEFLVLGLAQCLDVADDVPAHTSLAIRYSVCAHIATNVAVEGCINGEQS